MELAILQLVLTKGIGDVRIRRFCEYACRVGSDLAKAAMVDVNLLRNELGFSEEVSTLIVSHRADADRLWRRLKNNGIRILWKGGTDYPARMIEVLGENAPPVLYVKGDVGLLTSHSAGFCGSRHASDKGLLIAEDCAREFSKLGVTVVSGCANGVDVCAHVSAIKNGGKTIFVLPEGILSCRVRDEVQRYSTTTNSLYVSQFAPDVSWFAHNAMKRNDLIIALSNAMIVIEAGERGGSIAAGMSTLKLKRPLFVVDYKNPPPSAIGNGMLLAAGGRALRSTRNGHVQISPIMNCVVNNPQTHRSLSQMELQV